MQDLLFTEKGVTPDDHYEKARAWAVGNRTWHDQNHVGDSRIYLGIPPGLFPPEQLYHFKKRRLTITGTEETGCCGAYCKGLQTGILG